MTKLSLLFRISHHRRFASWPLGLLADRAVLLAILRDGKADLDDDTSLVSAMNSVFSTSVFESELEEIQGKNLTNAAAETGAEHFVRAYLGIVLAAAQSQCCQTATSKHRRTILCHHMRLYWES